MNVTIEKHKKKIVAGLALCAAAAISIPLLLPRPPAEDTVREREYTVTRDTITVGVESSGLVDAGPNAHSLEAGTVVKDLLVTVGSEVKKGDPLASISTKNLKELIQAAKNERSDARAALLQASSSKDVLIAQTKKDQQDGLQSIQQEFDAQMELLTSEKTRLEASIQEQEETLAQLQEQISHQSTQVGDLEEIVDQRKSQINQNILAIGRLNEELLQVDDGTEERNELNRRILEVQHQLQLLRTQLGTAEDEEVLAALQAEIANEEGRLLDLQKKLLNVSNGEKEMAVIRLKITRLENENTALQQEIDAYLENPSFAELERLKTEQTETEDLLANNYDALTIKLEEIERSETQLQQALEKQNGQNAFLDYKTSAELKAIHETIAKASQSVKTAQEKVDHLQNLFQNPTIYAQLDGVVTALHYAVGDTIVEGKPLCIVGQLGEITMTVPVNASDIGRVSVGQKVNVYVDAYAEEKFTGTVTKRLLVANDNGEYPVTIAIDPGQQMLLPGMKAYATIILKEKPDVLTLSNKAIALENGQQHVLVRNETGELVRKQIVTGFSDGRVSEILEGLSENDVVIVQE